MVVQTGLTFNYGEFAGIKPGVVDGFPDAEEFDSVAVAQPVGDEEVAVLGVAADSGLGKALSGTATGHWPLAGRRPAAAMHNRFRSLPSHTPPRRWYAETAAVQCKRRFIR